MKKTKLICILASLFEIVFSNGCKDRLFDNPLDPNADKKAYEILATIPIEGIVPVDLVFSRDSLWVVDTFSRILSLDFNSGSQIRELSVGKRVNGIAYDGDGLWLSVQGIPEIIKVNILTGTIVQTLAFSRGDFGTMDYFEGRLYIADRLSNSILAANLTSGSIEKTIPNPGFSLNGVTFDGTYLWTIDAPQLRIYKMTADGSVIIYYQTPAKAGAGLNYDKEAGIIWSGDQSGKIFKLRFQ